MKNMWLIKKGFKQVTFRDFESVISSDLPSCKNGKSRFTATSLLSLSDHNVEETVVFLVRKVLKSQNS